MPFLSTHGTLPITVVLGGRFNLAVVGFVTVTIMLIAIRFRLGGSCGKCITLTGEERGDVPIGFVLVEVGEGCIKGPGILVIADDLLIVEFFTELIKPVGIAIYHEEGGFP